MPVGRITTAQMRGVADLAERYGNGDIRVTVGQNLIVPNIPETRIGALTDEPLFQELPYDPSPIMRGLVCVHRQRLLRAGADRDQGLCHPGGPRAGKTHGRA